MDRVLQISRLPLGRAKVGINLVQNKSQGRGGTMHHLSPAEHRYRI